MNATWFPLEIIGIVGNNQPTDTLGDTNAGEQLQTSMVDSARKC